MKHSNWTEADSRNAKRIWTEYQKQYDITEHIGQTAGIDPKSGRIWFSDSALEIVKKYIITQVAGCKSIRYPL